MNSVKLICETNFQEFDVIIEQENAGKPKEIKVKGPYIVCEVKNANGRIYKSEDMQKAVDEYIEEYVKANRALGELNHPESTDIDYNNACHMCTSLEYDPSNKLFIGESKVLLGTPKGDLLGGLLSQGVTVGMSTRGVGNVNNDNIVEDFKLIAVDAVSNPSGPGAFVEGILESKQFMIDSHGQIIEKAFGNLEKNLKNIPRRSDPKKDFLQNVIKEFIIDI
jgi:hypothetical protein